MSSWLARLRMAGIMLSLLVAVIVPAVASGRVYADLGQQAFARQDYLGAGQYFTLAARRLPWQPQLWNFAAFSYAVGRDWEQALPLLARARSLGVLSVNSWILYGYGSCCDGDAQPALRLWEAGLKQYPNELIFYYWAAWAHRQRGDFLSEQQALDTWLTAGKGKPVDYYRLAELLLASEPDRARAMLQQAEKLDPSYSDVAATLDTALTLAGRESKPARRLTIVGRGLGLTGDWLLAQWMFEQAVAADPRYAQAWALLGEARQENGQDGKPALDKALELDPNSSIVHALRGLYWKRQGLYAAQLAEYQRASQLEPDSAEWYADLGEAYGLTGNLAAAFASYQKATELAPENATYWRLLALFCADNGVHLQEAGLPAARKAAQLAPDDPLVLDAFGWTLSQAGLLQGAQKTLLQATYLDPGSAAAHLHLGETYLRMGDQKSALVELELARQLDGGGPIGDLAWKLISQYAP